MGAIETNGKFPESCKNQLMYGRVKFLKGDVRNRFMKLAILNINTRH